MIVWQTDKQADRKVGRQTDRQTDRLIDWLTNRQADRQIEKQTDKQIENVINTFVEEVTKVEVCMCVCVRERERVWEKERERERESGRKRERERKCLTQIEYSVHWQNIFFLSNSWLFRQICIFLSARTNFGHLKPHLHEQWRFQFLSRLTNFARLSVWFCQALWLILRLEFSYLSVWFCAMWCLSVGCS